MKRKYSVVLIHGTEVKVIAERLDSAREAMQYAREMNRDIFDGTALYAAVAPCKTFGKATTPAR